MKHHVNQYYLKIYHVYDYLKGEELCRSEMEQGRRVSVR